MLIRQSDIRVNLLVYKPRFKHLCRTPRDSCPTVGSGPHANLQRYNHPLKAARIRQYLHEGVEGWHIPAIAEAVPALIHVSLFLFLIGLGDFLLNANGKVGKATVSFIVVYCSFYIITTVTPVMKPQSSLRNPFYVLLCHLAQKFRLRRYRDRVDGNLKQVNTNMAEGQMELAMEKKPTRKRRDEGAIRWLAKRFTEDIEMESFALGIPGSFIVE